MFFFYLANDVRTRNNRNDCWENKNKNRKQLKHFLLAGHRRKLKSHVIKICISISTHFYIYIRLVSVTWIKASIPYIYFLKSQPLGGKSLSPVIRLECELESRGISARLSYLQFASCHRIYIFYFDYFHFVLILWFLFCCLYFSSSTSGCNGIFSRRLDFSSFNMLPKTRLNSYQVKVSPAKENLKGIPHFHFIKKKKNKYFVI